MELSLGGKVVVVTGVSRGIGLAVARAFAEEGAEVVAGSRTASEDLKELAGGYPLLHVALDLGTPQGPEKLVESTVERYDEVDVLVNNVGVFEPRLAGFESGRFRGPRQAQVTLVHHKQPDDEGEDKRWL